MQVLLLTWLLGVVLGGGHDLTELVKKHKGWGYVRLTPKGYPDLRMNRW